MRIAVPPPAAQKAPILVIGWITGALLNPARAEAAREHSLLQALLGRAAPVLKAHSEVGDLLVVFTGSSYLVANKTLYEFVPNDVESAATSGADFGDLIDASMANPAHWSPPIGGPGLPLTYLTPDPSVLTGEFGDFIRSCPG